MVILVTGSSGFIGYHLCRRLIADGYEVIGVDNMNAYYDVDLKEYRLELLRNTNKFKFYRLDITDISRLCDEVFEQNKIDAVIHLAGQAGVRYSLQNPTIFMETNVMGFFNILECCRIYKVKKLLFASSSSVYGNENDTNKPVSVYAATKKSNEILAYTYSQLYQIETIGMRFFSVYGKLGRPDMAYYKFTKSIFKNEPVVLFYNGNMYRDFTYIDDVVESICRLLSKKGELYDIFDIGRGNPVKMSDFLNILYETLKKCGRGIGELKITNTCNENNGDVFWTNADNHHLYAFCGYKPETGLKEGLERFAKWYVNYNDM